MKFLGNITQTVQHGYSLYNRFFVYLYDHYFAICFEIFAILLLSTVFFGHLLPYFFGIEANNPLLFLLATIMLAASYYCFRWRYLGGSDVHLALNKTGRRIKIFILDFMTVLFISAMVLALSFGAEGEDGIQLSGIPAMMVVLPVIIYFVVCRLVLGGTIWQRLARWHDGITSKYAGVVEKND